MHPQNIALLLAFALLSAHGTEGLHLQPRFVRPGAIGWLNSPFGLTNFERRLMQAANDMISGTGACYPGTCAPSAEVFDRDFFPPAFRGIGGLLPAPMGGVLARRDNLYLDEKTNEYVYEADMPGVEIEDVRVELVTKEGFAPLLSVDAEREVKQVKRDFFPGPEGSEVPRAVVDEEREKQMEKELSDLKKDLGMPDEGEKDDTLQTAETDVKPHGQEPEEKEEVTTARELQQDEAEQVQQQTQAQRESRFYSKAKYSYSVRLPSDVDEESVRATLKRGVLNVRVGRKEKKEDRSRRAIPVEHGA
uniref:SHSP domain-containing protein n=1 Tax=Chromera velia CCMP2878 TaxID=1169474 RepID=A0A0G4HSS3_9ALVE|mmetsp:Transcript_23719/g.46595  ORF Transcript_23719/g.46595 Transcript_23719/m.46595 type:complete len:305 (-) Transcript_23719:748-1662(-)|eukprot:Cvel_8345.t1-p1 / transcript=Cvel_8345.t1 / gene=Cvel_8345 / organism=Chromera_velia_CCMP2878 / gene_product=hypothetical protein / transcript_product=hypothetical protein / location=Cvel_scaffold459:55735-57215(-) / protein_length=304 / sequence_SO=supercontig / SO=protein_coding / is_pseudo=false